MKSKQFIEKHDAFVNEMLECLREVLTRNGGKLELNQEDYLLPVGYNIDCECFDDLENIHLSGSSIEADLSYESDVDLNYFHERSLIDIIEYLEKHGFMPVIIE